MRVLTCLFLAFLLGAGESPPSFDVPRIPRPHIDGDAAEWSAAACVVPLAAVGVATDPTATARLAWCEAGLAVAVTVHDEQAREDAARPWQGDAVELFLAPDERGSIDFCQWAVAPGRAGSATPLLIDRRVDRLDQTTSAAAEIVVRSMPGGYKIEALLPWTALRIDPVVGTTCRVQVIVDDADKPDTAIQRLSWHPLVTSADTPAAFQRIRLAERATAIAGTAAWRLEQDGHATVEIAADDAAAAVDLTQEGRLLAQGQGHLAANLELPLGDAPLIAHAAGQVLALVPPRPEHVPYWEGSIRRYEAADRLHQPAPGGIIFYGSSTMTRWETLAEDFPGRPVIGRGFGGSTVTDALRYAPRIVLPLHPSAVVLYTGGNGLEQTGPAHIGDQMRDLVELIHAGAPGARVVLLTMKPTIKNLSQRELTLELNRRYLALAEDRPWLACIDAYTPFLDAAGNPEPSLLAADRLHPSRLGYTRLAELITPHLP